MSNQEIGEWRHIVLYAKGWYEKNNTMEDLRTIMSKITGVETKFISDNRIYENVTGVFNQWISEYAKDLFLKELFHSGMFTLSNDINIVVITEKMLSKLSLLKVKDGNRIVFDIGEPDENVLPFSKEGKNETAI